MMPRSLPASAGRHWSPGLRVGYIRGDWRRRSDGCATPPVPVRLHPKNASGTDLDAGSPTARSRVLMRGQLGVPAPCAHELRMCPALLRTAAFHHQDLVRCADGGELMRNGHARTSEVSK